MMSFSMNIYLGTSSRCVDNRVSKNNSYVDLMSSVEANCRL